MLVWVLVWLPETRSQLLGVSSCCRCGCCWCCCCSCCCCCCCYCRAVLSLSSCRCRCRVDNVGRPSLLCWYRSSRCRLWYRPLTPALARCLWQKLWYVRTCDSHLNCRAGAWCRDTGATSFLLCQDFLTTHLGVNEIAYPPSGSESSAGLSLSSKLTAPTLQPIVR